MCRWLAYSGPPIRLSTILTKPDHSLIDQSRHARKNQVTTNGDGFGVGWYGTGTQPALYRNTHPAWNDLNIQQLAEQIDSRLFLAHVRAATGTPVQQTNCHPFVFQNWLFQHNGAVPDFGQLKRQLMFEIDPVLFPLLTGSTDSEVLFFLALSLGLQEDPPRALARLVGHVERVRHESGIDTPFTFSACTTDGRELWAVRFSSDNHSRTLYHSRHIHALRDVHGSYSELPEGAVLVLSEPLDELTSHWEEVPESSLLIVEGGTARVREFVPQ